MASVNKPIRSSSLERSKPTPPYWPAGSFVNVWPRFLAEAGDGVPLDELFVELEAESRPLRRREASVLVDPRLFHEHLAQRRSGPARGLVRELEPGGVGDGGDEMEIGQEPDTVGPGVGRDEQARGP